MSTTTSLNSQTFLDNIKQAAQDFVVDNVDDAVGMTEDVVEAILFTEVVNAVPIPPLSEDPSHEELADHAEILAQRDRSFLLVIQAQKTENARVARIRESARGVVSTVIRNVAGLALGTVLGG